MNVTHHAISNSNNYLLFVVELTPICAGKMLNQYSRPYNIKYATLK